MRVLSLLLIFGYLIYAFEIEMIDDTIDGKTKPEKAKDGKTIYKPIKKNIIEPMERKILQPLKKKIVYPIGSSVNADIEPKNKESKNDMNQNFTSKENLKLESNQKNIEVEVDKFFKGLKESNNTKEINPVNIEQ
jgi:hypothetical protein